jgi:3-hydroxymyristoyl/3-hydroxydecanoyl-(acyl carrier protein) dehydratase
VTFSFPEGILPNARFLDGHFDDDPLVPGAILVGYAVARLHDHGYEVDRFLRVKFFGKLRPEIPFEIACQLGENVSKLIWRAGDDVFAEARVQLSPSDG